MTIFGKGKKRGQAHSLKFNRALQTLLTESINRPKSVIVRTALSKPVAFMSGISPVPDIGTVFISEGQAGTFSDTQAPTSRFTVDERVGGFLVDWDDMARRWDSNELQIEAGGVQLSVAISGLLTIIDKARDFVSSYC